MGSGQSTSQSVVSSSSKSTKTTSVTVTTEMKDVPHFKIVLMGEPYVGKSSIFYRYTKNQFFQQYLPSRQCNIENVVRKLNQPRNQVASVTLWDLPGREDMDIRESYFRNVDAAIVVVDMDNPDSIAMAGTWKQEFFNKTSHVELVSNKISSGITVSTHEQLPFDPKQIPVLLIGNKYDLVEEKLADGALWLVDPPSQASDTTDKEATDERIAEGLAAKLGLDMDFNQMEDPKDNSRSADQTGEGDSNGGREFTPILGPRRGEKKPECVVQLEQVQQQHGFVGSVIVSAKDNDNSVHLAIQSLVRHLLERQTRRRLKIKRRKEKKKVKEEPVDPDLLVEVKYSQIDQPARRCNLCIQRLRLVVKCYEAALRKFKQACADAAIIREAKCSLEDCVTALKNNMPPGRELRTEEEEGFLSLVVDGHPENKIDRDVQVALDTYHSEYARVCRAILRDFPILDDLLGRLDTKISERCDNATSLYPELALDAQKLEQVVAMCEKNRAKVAHMRLRLKEYLDIVETASQKIRAALIW